MNIKLGLGLSLGTVIVAELIINAIADHNEKKYDTQVRLAEIEANKAAITKEVKTENKNNKTNNKKGNNKK